MRLTRIPLLILASALGLAAAPAAAQTPDDACAADSLYLISPRALEIELQETGRLGMLIRWANLDLDQATCYTLNDIDNLQFVPEVTGGFGDKVDRVLGFSTSNVGTIGAAQSEPLVVNWRTVGAATYGSLAGVLNLANNGGIVRWNEAARQWQQMNAGLPMTWRQVNVVALAEASDATTMYAGFTGGQTTSTEPKGLYRFDGASWSRLAPAIFEATNRVTAIAVDPGSRDRVAVGTATKGLYISTDGGQTFTNWTTALDPAFPDMPTSFRVTALAWSGGRLFVAVANLGVFVSSDSGASFSRVDLRVPDNLDRYPDYPDCQGCEITYVQPLVNSFTVGRFNPDRILASLYYHGVYESTDGGDTWRDLYGNLLVSNPDEPGNWVHTAQSVAIDPADGRVMVMGVLTRGLYRTADGGETWSRVATEPGLQPENSGALTLISVTSLPGYPGRFLAAEDNWALLESTDGGVSWQRFGTQPVINKMLGLRAANAGGGDLLLASWAGGMYVPGTPLPLRETYTAETSPDLRSLDLGLSITFPAGMIADGDAFELVCQTFQGWAVWRAPAYDQENMQMLGLYDRVNPETCTEGYCGDVSYDPIPLCFRAKRAACFVTKNADGSEADTLQFFDDEIYNGFSYYYSVTSFDYGNTASTTPENNNKAAIHSPRWTGDEQSPFTGEGNRSYVQVNLGASAAASGDEIYAYPNPLRLDSGIPGEDGRTVVFTNLPPDSRVRIFTTAGDIVANLPEDFDDTAQVGGQMRWNTINTAGSDVAAGVYLYKVEMPQREEYWGRLVIIR